MLAQELQVGPSPIPIRTTLNSNDKENCNPLRTDSKNQLKKITGQVLYPLKCEFNTGSVFGYKVDSLAVGGHWARELVGVIC